MGTTAGLLVAGAALLMDVRRLCVIAAFLPAARRFRVVAAFIAAVRRFRVTAAFRAADVPIVNSFRSHESSGLANVLPLSPAFAQGFGASASGGFRTLVCQKSRRSSAAAAC